MWRARGQFRPTMVVLASLSSSSSSVVSPSFPRGGEVKQLHVTRFFAALFPAYFPPGRRASKVISTAAADLLRALSRKELSTSGVAGSTESKWGGATAQTTDDVSLRSWHVMANLKHAMLHISNGEERTQGSTSGANYSSAGAGHTDNKQSCADKDDTAPMLSNVGDRWEVGRLRGDGRPFAMPGDIARLVRHAIRLIKQRGKGSSEVVTLLPDVAPLQEMKISGGGGVVVVPRGGGGVLHASDEVPLACIVGGGGGGDGMREGAQEIQEPLRCAVKQALRLSSHMFHLTFEALVRQGQGRLAVELFRRWWKHNPHLFPIELELHREDDVALMVRDMREKGGGDRNGSSVTVQWDMIARRLAQVPYKKYLVSSALFSRVLVVTISLDDRVLEDEFVVQELLYNGVYRTVCGGVDGRAPDSSNTDLRFHLFREKYEDWLVLVGAVAAAALLERHTEEFLRNSHGGASYDHLVSVVLEEYLTLMCKACGVKQQQQQQPQLLSMDRASTGISAAPGWAKLLFTTVLRCYEESGVFHASPARRPGTTAPLWRQIHARLLCKFPHVFHAGNTVTTLLSFAALEEAAVSSMGTHRISFFGKEEGLRKWRLDCLSHRLTDKNVSDGGATWAHVLGDLPRASRRLRARFVTAHSSLSSAVGEAAATTTTTTTTTGHAPQQLHWKHRELFGTAFNASASHPSIAVFPTAEEVNQCASDALDEIESARRGALEIFRDHTALPILCPASSVATCDSRENRSQDDIIAEASPPSVFLFLRLVSFLASLGEPPRAADMNASVKLDGQEKEGNGADRFPLADCLEKDILPFCQPSVAAYLRRCCATYLSRSSGGGVGALVTEYQSLLQHLTEEAAVERLLVGLLWSGGYGDKAASSSQFLAGSGSLAWQVVAQHRGLIFSGESQLLLGMILSHLVTLSIAIPDDCRRMIYVSPCMHRLSQKAIDEEATALSELREELHWKNPPPAVHLYISLLELLCWAAEAKVGERERVQRSPKTVSDSNFDANCLDSEEDNVDALHAGGRDVPSLCETARHWRVVQGFLRTQMSASIALPPFILERVCLILVHSSPDAEMLLTCLLSLFPKQQRCEDAKTKGSSVARETLEDETISFVTPRLLASLCGLLRMNGVNGDSVQRWRRQNGAPSGDNGGALREWHHACFERMTLTTTAAEEETSAEGDGCSAGVGGGNKGASVLSVYATSAVAHLLGSVVLDILLSDAKWESLRRDNYYAALFMSTSGDSEGAVACERRASSFPLGVVLPSRQLTSAHPTGVRHRVTNLRDALREMSAEQRLQMRRSLSPSPPSLPHGEAVLATHSLAAAGLGHDGAEEDDAVAGVLRFFGGHVP